jgi:lipopolysaccharide biosynthesis regulator YciM
MDLTMDLSIRKQQQQQSPAPPSRPILNPAAPSSMLQSPAGRNSPHLPPLSTASSALSHTPVHQQQIKQQSHQYVPIPPAVQQQLNQVQQHQQQLNQVQQHQQRVMQQTKYVQLLNVIEEMGKDIKPTYAGNKNSAERLRRAIASARVLVRECQLECDRNSRP